MFDRAISFALVTMLAWGGWAIFAKLATESLLPETVTVISYSAGTLVAIGYVASQNFTMDPFQRASVFAVLAGVFSAVGAIALYAGLKRGSASIVTTISALYFVVAAILGIVLFGESLGLREAVGIGFGILAIVLLVG